MDHKPAVYKSRLEMGWKEYWKTLRLMWNPIEPSPWEDGYEEFRTFSRITIPLDAIFALGDLIVYPFLARYSEDHGGYVLKHELKNYRKEERTRQ